MNRIKEWYSDRIQKGELNLSGWSRDFSQKIRFEKTVEMIVRILGWGKFSVLDYGCGTGDFAIVNKEHLISYIGIDFRLDAIQVARSRGLTCYAELPTELPRRAIEVLMEVPRTLEVVVANAAFGFAGQTPVDDLCAAAELAGAKAIVADFFSSRRPYEPDMDGYHTFEPMEIVDGIRKRMGWNRFAIDHSFMPHVYLVGVFDGVTSWETEEGSK